MFFNKPLSQPTVKIVDAKARTIDSCLSKRPRVVGDSNKFLAKLSGMPCQKKAAYLWSVSGAQPAPGQANTDDSFSVINPDPSVEVTVTVQVTFDDGSMLTASLKYHSVTQAEADWAYLLCKLTEERLKPIPWWEWDPEKLRNIASVYLRTTVTGHRAKSRENLAGASRSGSTIKCFWSISALVLSAHVRL